ncbi:MAG: electron transfer flavoprotein subunit alpha/FixB family protein, partial [Clostridia bacterium]|nr:electron transfer flavoprotein subunit alpha/FixB family protein [Clostridia bacterium]
CTKLELRDGIDLVQIRPAFGGNIMAQIVTPDSRPLFATVRYRVMDAPARSAEPSGRVILRELSAFESAARFLGASPLPPAADISAADALVVAGRGLRRETDLAMVRELAGLLGGDWAVSRPLAERGWAEATRQIGLSGRTVRPGLIITCGVSGAIQFTACMRQSGYIVAIDRNEDAPIFQAAHLGLVGDLYEIVPELIAALRTSLGEEGARDALQ